MLWLLIISPQQRHLTFIFIHNKGSRRSWFSYSSLADKNSFCILHVTLPGTKNTLCTLYITLLYFLAQKTHFFPEKCDLNSTCILCAEGKYYFQTYKYLYIYNTTSLSWDSEICFQIMKSGITAHEQLTFLTRDLP